MGNRSFRKGIIKCCLLDFLAVKKFIALFGTVRRSLKKTRDITRSTNWASHKQDCRPLPAYFSPSNFVEDAFLKKMLFSQICNFSNILKFYIFFQKTWIFVEKKRLKLHHFSCILQWIYLFPILKKNQLFSKKVLFVSEKSLFHLHSMENLL